MGCGESKHDVATGNILSKIKKPSFRSVSSLKSKKAAETATKGGESLVEKKSDVKGKEEAVASLEATQQICPAKETEQKVENAKPVVVLAEEKKPGEEKTLLQETQAVKEIAAAVIVEEKKPVEEKPLLQETQAVKENAAAVVIAEEKKPVEEKPLLQETKVEKEKEEPIAVQEEKPVVIKEEGVATKVEEEKTTKEGSLAVKEQVKAAQLVEEKATKEDNLAIKKEVEEAGKSVSTDEAKPLTETRKEEKPAIEKETKADSAAANGLKISSEMK